ncbi:Universal stress protein family protein [Candidatus Nitrosocosmicus oleophilus]|jgi:nucleotide-binding universal stress UspA family protein|uniref:Universal stress protein family protein n=1 Tax=Candidatus Nitrosocosmicus oleophilus TaxID=1353260 RepID=A0A654M348_9ARCH|nr:universal stress protein [Candidatus Nitrosocosmicus oleophilus]ALI37083.1 Universal stress protein family protein [Candidatus Nitrosocosmicus oleophilus]
MKILTLVDGSNHSLRALEYVSNLLGSVPEDSGPGKSELLPKHEMIILTVLQPFILSKEVIKNFESMGQGRKKLLDKYLKDIYSVMQTEWIKKLSSLKSKYNKIGLAISTKIITGSHSSRFIAYTIVKFAEDKGIDLIVVGSVGTGGISKNKSLGSVTRNIAEISTSPVLIVP